MAGQAPSLSPDAAQAAVATWIAGLSAMATPLIEAAVGYRTQLEAQGFSPAMAEMLAVQYHANAMCHLWRMFAMPVGGPK